jgi:hypothetical protein
MSTLEYALGIRDAALLRKDWIVVEFMEGVIELLAMQLRYELEGQAGARLLQ